MNKDKIREALEFYANGGHLQINDLEEWESPSGEGENWLCPPGDEAIAVENGGIARAALDDDGWVECGERLPEDGAEVLAYVPYYGRVVLMYSEKEGWFRDWWSNKYPNKVKEWRELPPPPEEL